MQAEAVAVVVASMSLLPQSRSGRTFLEAAMTTVAVVAMILGQVVARPGLLLLLVNLALLLPLWLLLHLQIRLLQLQELANRLLPPPPPPQLQPPAPGAPKPLLNGKSYQLPCSRKS